MIVGHTRIKEFLETGWRPRVSLFTGPASVGKWTMAEHLRRSWGIHDTDLIRVRSLTMDMVRGVADLINRQGIYGERLFIIRLDGATPEARNGLLKVLEEIGDDTHIILITSEPQPETLMSRSTPFFFSLLTDEQVEVILRSRHFSDLEAKKLAKASGGQVRNALSLADNGDLRIGVLAALRAVLERDTEALDTLAAKWTDEHTLMMESLCTEVVTERWALFDPGEVEGAGKPTALAILSALKPNIRPRLAVRSGLMAVLRSRA